MDIDFPVAQFKRSFVSTVVGALRLTRDPEAYSTGLITAEGIRVFRVVVDENDVPIELSTLNLQKH